MKSKSAAFYISVFAIFLGIISPALFSDGMFMDGLIYATIAKNLANGMGSFWYLKFSETFFSAFHEHPPLAMALQSIFFKIFGDSIYVERFYSMGSFLITGYIMVLIWKEVCDKKMAEIAWLALILWISIPLVTWAAANNMLENTMMVFTSLSVFFMLKSANTKVISYTGLAGLMLFFAFLSKGFTALFPLSLFFWLWVFNWQSSFSFKNFLIHTFLLLFSFLLPFFLIYLFDDEAVRSLENYFNIQVLNSLNNIQTVDSRFYILYRLLRELIPALLIAGLICLIARRTKMLFIKKSTKLSKSMWVFLALGLSGVLPIIISMKQSGFYILATFPFFAMAIALFVARIVLKWYESVDQHSKSFGIFKKIAVASVLIAAMLASLHVGRLGRDKAMLKDIYAVMAIVPDGSIVSLHPDLGFNWSLYGYFHRYADISLDTDSLQQHEFYLGSGTNSIASSQVYEELQMNLQKFRLYRRK